MPARSRPVTASANGLISGMSRTASRRTTPTTNTPHELPVGAEYLVTSCDSTYSYEAAEPVSSQRPNGSSGGRGSGACGRPLMQRSVRPVRVVMLGELA